jgi:hypothetical protein
MFSTLINSVLKNLQNLKEIANVTALRSTKMKIVTALTHIFIMGWHKEAGSDIPDFHHGVNSFEELKNRNFDGPNPFPRINRFKSGPVMAHCL